MNSSVFCLSIEQLCHQVSMDGRERFSGKAATQVLLASVLQKQGENFAVDFSRKHFGNNYNVHNSGDSDSGDSGY